MAYIYKITNTFLNKIYIGKTVRSDINERFKEHISNGRKIYAASEISKSLREYGTINHKIELIEECDENIVLEREQYWINYYNSIENGFNIKNEYVEDYEKNYWGKSEIAKKNIKSGLKWNTGITPSDEIKKKISLTKKQKFLEGLYENSYGHSHTEETKIKLSKIAKERLKNAKNPNGNLYNVFDENGIVMHSAYKQQIAEKYNLSTSNWKTLLKFSTKTKIKKMHPKYNIFLEKVE